MKGCLKSERIDLIGFCEAKIEINVSRLRNNLVALKIYASRITYVTIGINLQKSHYSLKSQLPY